MFKTSWCKILATFAFIILVIPVYSISNPSFIKFNMESGLAHNTVNCILQDKSGFMWFGTKDGLSRFDGSRFKNYRNDKDIPFSIGNNCIRSIFQGTGNEIWIGTDDGVYIYHPTTDRFERFNVSTKNGLRIENEVNDIKQDKDGVLWFAVDWQGVFSYNPQSEQLGFYELNTIVNVWCIHVDTKNNVWIGTHGSGLNYLDRDSGKFVNASFTNQNGDIVDLVSIYKISQYNYGNLLISTANNGVKKINLETGQVESFLSLGGYNPPFIRAISRRTENEIWFGTGTGVYIYDEFNQSTSSIHHSYDDPFSLSDDAIYSVYTDDEGGIWVGTYFGGVNYYPFQYTPFHKFYPIEGDRDKSTIVGRRVREFQLGNDGDLWIGTEDGGLSLFHPKTGVFDNFLPSDNISQSVSPNNIHGLLIDKEELWVGTYNQGLDVIDLKTQKVIRHYSKSNDANSLSDNSIFSIYKDYSDRIWIGTLYGLCYYNPSEDNFIRVTSLGKIFVSDITQTTDGYLWVGSLGSGLFRLDPSTNKWTAYEKDSDLATGLTSNKIISFFEDSRKTLWITTEGGGVCKYNYKSDDFTSFTTHDGLPNDVVYKIVEDDMHNLWLSTNDGLACMSLDNNSIKQYTCDDGLLSNQFNYKSGIKDLSGNIYFGCLDGFVSFNPSTFQKNEHLPPVYITQFELLNNIVYPWEDDSPLDVAIEFTKKIKLKHNQSSFGFTFAALSYVSPETNQYAYMLEGIDKSWIYLNDSHSAKYSNIPPGHYVFKVNATNSDGVWNDKPISLQIVISPPYYKTTFAYIIYILFFVGSIVGLLLFYRRTINKKNNRRREIFENQKIKEVYDAKIAFFTNIAHEIRTPLSLIKGPLDYILGEKVSEKEIFDNLNVIDRNTSRLLNLSNQLLDFRKTEEKGFQLNYISTDVIDLINDTITRFNSLALKRKITIKKDFFADVFYADIDKEALTKILSNLLSNAIKYGDSKVCLFLEKGDETFSLNICNDGSKIEAYLGDKIFEPFYQINDSSTMKINKGTGLGLPLSRSLAELHGGELVYVKEEEVYNVFKLTLPINQLLSVKQDTPVLDESITVDIPQEKSSQYALLIVEDDEELRLFLINQLTKCYDIFQASNGDEALLILKDNRIDLIISDIMMPVKDGVQLCKELSEDTNYSHIPVVLLTAKSNLQSKIDALDVGAAAYIEKPFSMKWLTAQVSNLLSSRNRLKEAFSNNAMTKVNSIAPTKADEEFLKKVTDIVISNISDSQFNVDILAELLCMSRSSFHRKIKGVSKLTPNEFILLVKLKKAAEYLNEGHRISEVGFLVGFSSASYFSKAFKKQFGVSPKNWGQ